MMDLIFIIGIPFLVVVAVLTFIVKVIISIFKSKKEKVETVDIGGEEKEPKKEKIRDGKCPKCGSQLTELFADGGLCYSCPECHFKQKM